jgi:DNA-binding HxlR family transcriptional regulator/putative sterol carrier protein
MTTKRTYNQYCGVASALDVLGERWTLLIVRELLVRPRRYGELLGALPGMGTNLLAERMKFLVDMGIVRRTSLGGTSKRATYELTEKGHALRPIVLGLARWGMEFVGDLSPEYELRPSWALLAVEAMIDPEQLAVDEQYEFHIDDEVFHIEIRDGQARTVAGPAESPAITITTDAATFVRIGARKVSPLAALVTGKLALEGDTEAMLRACELLGLEATPAAWADLARARVS